MRSNRLILPKLIIGLLLLSMIVMAAALALAADYDANNLPATWASYFGGSAADQITAVDVAADGVIFVAGKMPGHNPGGVTPTEFFGGGDGVIMRVAADGSTVLSLARIGGIVNDLEISLDGTVVACGDFGVVTLTPIADDTTAQVDATALGGTATRCAIGGDGTFAALRGTARIFVYEPGGTLLKDYGPGSASRKFFDLAIDGFSQTVIETGYDQKAGNLQVAFMIGRRYTGAKKWTAYDFSASAVFGQGLGADSRGERVAIGDDGLLYFAGYVDGGNSIYGRNPQNISQKLGNTKLIKTDAYNDPYNISGAKALAWYGRFNPETGVLARGQFLLTRLSDGKGNSIAIKAITADTDGVIYAAGEAYASIQDRAARQVAGVTVGDYAGGEPFVLVVNPALTKRLYWSPFAAPGQNGGGSPASGIGVGGYGVVAVGVTLKTDNAGKGLITVNPLQGTPGGGDSDAYVAVWNETFELPGTPILAQPNGGTPIPAYAPFFDFTGNPADEGYRLQIRLNQKPVVVEEFSAGDICTSGDCRIDLNTTGVILKNSKAYDWRVEAFTVLGKAASTRNIFGIDYPGKPALSTPTGAAKVSRTPTFTWTTNGSAATQYRVKIVNSTSGKITTSGWLEASAVCNGGSNPCTYALTAEKRLALGKHTWQVEARDGVVPNISRTARRAMTVTNTATALRGITP
jgi:hypothetical protein